MPAPRLQGGLQDHPRRLLEHSSIDIIHRRTFCMQFLTRDVKKRLGCGKDGRRDIERHVFFKETNWDAMQKMQVPPPFVPQTGDEANFDSEYTTKDVKLTPPDPKFIAAIDQEEFGGFTFARHISLVMHLLTCIAGTRIPTSHEARFRSSGFVIRGNR